MILRVMPPPLFLQAYSSNLVDYHLILDLLPSLARLYLSGQLPATLSYGQAAILLCLGLQQRELNDVEAALGLPGNQVGSGAAGCFCRIALAVDASKSRCACHCMTAAVTSAAGVECRCCTAACQFVDSMSCSAVDNFAQLGHCQTYDNGVSNESGGSHPLSRLMVAG